MKPNSIFSKLIPFKGKPTAGAKAMQNKFRQDIIKAMDDYYKACLSERIKEGMRQSKEARFSLAGGTKWKKQ